MKLHPAETTLLLAALALFFFSFKTAQPALGNLEPGAKPANVGRVLTWNIGGSGGGGHPASSETLPWVVESLLLSGADLILLQELESRDQARQLVARLGSDWVFLCSPVREGRCQLVAARNEQLEDGPLRDRGRMLSFIWKPDNYKPITGVNLHGDMLSAQRRNRLIGRSVDMLSGHKPAILAGDLNLDVDGGKRGDLFSDNSYRDVETYNYVAQKFRDSGLGRGSTAEPDRRLDYLFLSPEFNLLRGGPWKGRRRADMDHDPVFADLLFSVP